jgi:hypothetical protein
MIIMSCKLKPGSASNCARVHFTPAGMKRFSTGNTPSASEWLPMRHNKLSVLRRAPWQLGHSV